MDSEGMKPDEAALIRARLHIRGGKRRLFQGKFAAGVAALHDALIHGIQWYLLSKYPELVSSKAEGNYDLTDDDTLLQLLYNTPLFTEALYIEEFQYLSEVLDQALYKRMNGFDQVRYMKTIHNFMNKLGVEPFSDTDLPPEDPSTY